MKAYSSETLTEYDSWDDLVAAETNGWAVVVIFGEDHRYARTIGPFPRREDARRAAATQRRRWNKALLRHNTHPRPVTVRIEPLWKDIQP